jgi:hypothetical protein
MTGQCALLTAEGGLVAEELARPQAQHRLVGSVALTADLDLALDHDVVRAR